MAVDRTGHRPRGGAGVAAGLVAAALLAACGVGRPETLPSPSTGSAAPPRGGDTRVPPPPPRPSGTLGTAGPPIVWVGGRLTEVTEGFLRIREPLGPEVTVRLLGAGATQFFRVVGRGWQRTDPAAASAGVGACVEVLMDRSTLLALRVFLGADCGPA